MQSKAATVEAYLAELPEERRVALEAIRGVILANLDPKVAEGIAYGMIGYSIPHSVYPPGYHCDPKLPLMMAGLASQKNYMSLYAMGVYMGGPLHDWFVKAWTDSGKKLDMGKACIRFKRLEDVPLEVIGELFKKTSADEYIRRYEANLAQQKKRK